MSALFLLKVHVSDRTHRYAAPRWLPRSHGSVDCSGRSSLPKSWQTVARCWRESRSSVTRCCWWLSRSAIWVKFPSALQTLAVLERHQPRFSRLYEERGHCYVALRQAPQAVAAFEQAVTLNYALPASWGMLEGLHRMTGQVRRRAGCGKATGDVAKIAPAGGGRHGAVPGRGSGSRRADGARLSARARR